MGVLLEAKERVKKEEKKKSELEYNSALFALLRQKRKEMADQAGVPPYVIFSDRTLIEMAAYYPQSRASLLTIAGIGQVKLNRYGAAFLEIIKPYCEKHGLKELHPTPSNGKNVSPQQSAGKQRSSVEIGERTRLVVEEFNEGITVKDLMDRHQVSWGTILEHLTKYMLAGNRLHKQEELDRLTSVTADQKLAAFSAFDKFGPDLLKPIFDALNGTINYDELRILRLLYLIDRKTGETAGPDWNAVK
jgi:ATP-dependent DNA helicase RecQ